MQRRDGDPPGASRLFMCVWWSWQVFRLAANGEERLSPNWISGDAFKGC